MAGERDVKEQALAVKVPTEKEPSAEAPSSFLLLVVMTSGLQLVASCS